MTTGAISPDIVAYCGQWELGPVPASIDVAIPRSDGAGCAVWTAQAVHANDEEARHVEGSPIAAQEGTPPIAHIGTAGQGMAYHHGVVALRRQLAPSRVRHRDIVQGHARLEGEGGDDGDVLVWNQGHERVFGL